MNKIIGCVFAALVATACTTVPAPGNLADPVQTDGGLVAGTGSTVRAFRGIPYAAAPVGDLRWKALPTPAPWQGVRDGASFGPDCMQPNEYPELRGAGMVFSKHRNDRAAAPIHGDELQYVFDNLKAPHRGRQRQYNTADERVAREMGDAWVRFAKTGNPNGGNLPEWKAYDAQTEPFLEFANEPTARSGYESPRLALIRDFYAQQRR